MGCVKRGGKGSSHPRGEFAPMGCVKKGGKGISHPRGDGTPTGGVLAHGLLKKKPQPLWNGWGFF